MGAECRTYEREKQYTEGGPEENGPLRRSRRGLDDTEMNLKPNHTGQHGLALVRFKIQANRRIG
jgi:hypothetical protein